MADTPTATQIGAAGASAIVVSHTPAVSRWALCYFGSWWDAADTPVPTTDDARDGYVIVAEVDPHRYTDLARRVPAGAHKRVVYARAPLLLSHGDDGVVHALSPTEKLAYRARPRSGRILLVGVSELPVSLATARLARETVRALLRSDGWALLHASAVTRHGRALLALGSKGAGKTTCALTLARRCGWELLANDRVFVRGDATGVRVLPWPAAAAIGLGLLDALGLYDAARDRIRSGDRPHPTQDVRVTMALRAGHRDPPRGPHGRELKAQVFPHQLRDWFGLRLATAGRAAALLFPTVAPGVTPSYGGPHRGLEDSDFFTATTEDRYPDIFGLMPAAREHANTDVREHLARLPHHTVTLGHDITANTELLHEIAVAI